jgi:hypothetical protein
VSLLKRTKVQEVLRQARLSEVESSNHKITRNPEAREKCRKNAELYWAGPWKGRHVPSIHGKGVKRSG